MDNYTPEEPKHSPWGASSAKRYLECPRSIRFQSQFPNSDSEFSVRGTLAHKLGDKAVSSGVCPILLADVFEEFETLEREDVLAVKEYYDFCQRQKSLQFLQSWAAEGQVSMRVFCAKDGAPEGFENMEMYGTLDFYALFPDFLVIADYKHGVGVFVDVVENEQLLSYALMKWNMLGRPALATGIGLAIIQPRAAASDESIRLWQTTTDYLLEFEKRLKAGILTTLQPDPPANPGSWCQFCKAAGSCEALGSSTFELVETGEEALAKYGEREQLDPLTLTDEKIADIVEKRTLIRSFLTAVEREALRRAQLGMFKDERLKVVKISARKAYKETAGLKTVTDAMAAYGIKPKDIINNSLITPAQVVKVIKENQLDKELQTQAIIEFETRFVEKESSGFKVALASERGEPITFSVPTAGLEKLTPPPLL